jgi:undecaprenyl-diphosphatase
MSFVQIAILAIIQGLAELLPVSSSAHVIIAQKLMGIDPSSPEMTFLLVMLHTGTMFAVIVYFFKRWKELFLTIKTSKEFLRNLIIATGVTGVVGLGLKFLIEKFILEGYLGHSKGEVENLFKITPLVASALFAVGIYIFLAGRKTDQSKTKLDDRSSFLIGLTQGLSLPFRGFSRSGSTISTGLFLGIKRELAEEFSFLLAVILTPPVVLLQLKRLYTYNKIAAVPVHFSTLITPGLIGMVFSFIAGLFALRWLSAWLEAGKWKFFGAYCLLLSSLVFILYFLNIL